MYTCVYVCMCAYVMSRVLPGSSVHGIFQARILEWVDFLLQGIFSTQGRNPCLLHLQHWQADSLTLSHLGSWCICIYYIY